MKLCNQYLTVAAIVLCAVLAHAEVKTDVNRKPADGAGVEFRFTSVPRPSRGDLAEKAKFEIIDGRRDRNGGDAGVLNDGQVPRGEDEPRGNLFFTAGTAGGRLLLDLGSVVEVGRVNSYSWHRDTRGPQVYTLYAADGKSAEFDAKPGLGTDPAGRGWKRIANVDSRPGEGEVGGQYGVSISDSEGPLGSYRYLLFDISRTEEADNFGNTFYSEIDVLGRDAVEPAMATGPEAPARPEADAPPGEKVEIVATAGDGYEIAFDVSEVPDLKEWVDTKLKPVCVKWYPMIVGMLPSEGYAAPKRFTVLFRKDMHGVAHASGTRITCAAPWFKQNLEGEAIGAVVHEMVHVVQQYRGARGGNRNPGWLVEGLADWVRWFNYEPESARPRPNPARVNYDDSYRTTGHFLNYLTHNYDKSIITKLNAAMRQGKYTEAIWKEMTGKTADELNQEWKQGLQ